ncbi:MAG: NAD-dependent epimerase/dehydratase family protein [Dehalococcoidales bacterium]
MLTRKKENKIKNVAITGVSGYLGTMLLKRIVQEAEVERVVGLDIREPAFESPKFIFIKHDVRQPFAEIFTNNKIDTAIHLAFIVTPIQNEKKAHRINIGGSKNFLDASLKGHLAQIYYVGSNTEYGAHYNNPGLFTEDMPLNPNPDFPYARDKATVDLMFQDFAKENPDICVTIGRTVAVTGPHGDSCGLNLLFLPVMVQPMDKNPLWQFIHEDDLVELVVLLLQRRKSCIYNLSGDGGLTYLQMIRELAKPSVRLPSWLLYWGTKITWFLHLQSRSQAGGVHLLEYPIMLSNEKVKQETGYRLRCTGEEAFDIFLQAAGKKKS